MRSHDVCNRSGTDLQPTVSELPGDVADDAQPQIAVESEPIDVLTGPWSSFDGASFAPSVSYHVGPVFIDSGREESIPDVHERETLTGQKPDPRRDR